MHSVDLLYAKWHETASTFPLLCAISILQRGCRRSDGVLKFASNSTRLSISRDVLSATGLSPPPLPPICANYSTWTDEIETDFDTSIRVSIVAERKNIKKYRADSAWKKIKVLPWPVMLTSGVEGDDEGVADQHARSKPGKNLFPTLAVTLPGHLPTALQKTRIPDVSICITLTWAQICRIDLSPRS